MSMKEVIESIEREMFDRAAREENKKIQEFLDRKGKYYIYIANFLAVPMRYEVIGHELAVDTVPVIHIKFENGKTDEISMKELMKFDTLDKCKMQCEKLNKDMEKHRRMWERDSRYIKGIGGCKNE